MKRNERLLIAGIAVSAFIHAAIIETVLFVNNSETARRLYARSAIVPFTVPPPPPPPAPPPPPKPKPKEPPRPLPNTDKPVDPPVEEVKEVFGASKETVAENTSGIGVRIGNTLAKEMEKDYTPPEEVRPLPKAAEEPRPAPPPRKFSPVPLFKIAKMPEVKTKITPTYPPTLRKDEVEGEVLLKVALDREGNIVSITVVSSDHDLFTESAIAAVKSWKFSPAFLPDGTPTDVVIEVPVIFQLEF